MSSERTTQRSEQTHGMRDNRPDLTTPAVAVGCAVLLALLGFGAPGIGSAQTPAEAGPSTPITMADCAECHEIVDAFAHGPHGRAMARWSPELLQSSCVGCHGPAEAHIDDPLPENIVRLPGPEACATCHQASSSQMWLALPAHRRNSIACLDCHGSGHEGSVEAEPLLTAPPYELCGGCHSEQAAGSRQPFAHRDGSEPFACTECHSAHDLERTGRLLAASTDGPCLDCHTELAGPFVFPHPPRSVHGCSDCHQPHGSTNPRLLTRRNQLNLCIECHTNVPAFHDLTQARFRNCVSCHVAVHGSNRDPVLFDP